MKLIIVIVSAELNNNQLNKFIALIKNFKNVIGNSIDDITSITPSF